MTPKKRDKSSSPQKSADAGVSTTQAAGSAGGNAHTGWLVAAAIVSATLVTIASFFPAARLWGINHLAFYSPPVRWIAIAVLALAFLPAMAGPAYRALIRLGERMGAGRGAGKTIAIAAVAIASMAGFLALRSSTLLLGDGQLIVRSFEAAEEGHDKVVMRSPKAIVTEELIAPGTTLLYYGASKIGTGPLKKTPLYGMQRLNCILGGLFMFLLLLIATSASIGAEQRVWLFLLALFSCSIELFFGYIENYTTPFLLLVLYTIAAFRALHNRGPLWLPALPLLLAVYAHVQSVLFVPSFVYLVLWKRAGRRRPALLQRWPTVFSCVAAIGVLACSAIPQLKRFYVPFGFRNETYGMLAPHHLADVVNEAFMLLPIVPLAVAMFWVTHREERAAGRRFASDAKAFKDPVAWFTHPAEWQFVATILVPCVFYLLFFHPEIGMARDWDLFMMTGIAIVPAMLLLLNRYTRATGASTESVARFALPALMVVIVTGMAWVGVNASEGRSVDRFQRILTYDRTHASYAWENLAMMHHDRGHMEEAIAAMRTASDNSHNPRQYVRLAVYLEETGRVDEAMKVLDDVLARHPDYTKARFRLVMFLEKRGDWARMLDVSKAGVENSPDEPIYHFFYGESLMRAGRTEEGLAVFRGCQGMALPPAAKQYVDATLKEHDRAGK